MKPDYRSYIKRQFSKYPYIVKCEKTGNIFKEINGENHKLYLRLLYILIIGSLGSIFNLSFKAISIEYVYIHWLIMFPIATVTILYISHRIYTRILYKVAKFEIIDERELIKYPGVIESLKTAELRSKRQKNRRKKEQLENQE